ncbi:hypothetical protein HWV23_15830 [Natronomonas halophila]|uniref:hypothetical protein n=1 Tax=Natronomonas halophila TaxID=2747817 RepID=UPI0015B49188|nr:hypothetical protein [Natronomonas halophila]QLD87130.1 hypothetical protein HWV23_15830 [Natronomonas halophila]
MKRNHESFKEILSYPYRLYLSGWYALTSRMPLGTNVFSKDWDVLVILDTCRVDALEAVADEYDFLDGRAIDSITSVGSATPEWIANTFTNEYREEIAETAYTSMNVYSAKILEGGDDPYTSNEPLFDLVDWDIVPASEFGNFYSALQSNPEDDEQFSPQVLTDRAISLHRSMDPTRHIIHYKHPHTPYTRAARTEDRDLHDYERRPLKHLAEGTVAKETVWELYLDELRWALDHVEVLLQSIDAESVVLTADHGECFGELGVHRHPIGVPHPTLRRVPWVELSATDTGEYEPEYSHETDSEDTGPDDDVQQHLEHLGYV